MHAKKVRVVWQSAWQRTSLCHACTGADLRTAMRTHLRWNMQGTFSACGNLKVSAHLHRRIRKQSAIHGGCTIKHHAKVIILSTDHLRASINIYSLRYVMLPVYWWCLCQMCMCMYVETMAYPYEVCDSPFLAVVYRYLMCCIDCYLQPIQV